MKKLLSSILAGTMLISSIGAISVFADTPETATTAIVENVEQTEVQTNNPQVESSEVKEASKESNPVKKGFFDTAKDYVVKKFKAAAKEVSEHKLKYTIIAASTVATVVIGYFGCKYLAGSSASTPVVSAETRKEELTRRIGEVQADVNSRQESINKGKRNLEKMLTETPDLKRFEELSNQFRDAGGKGELCSVPESTVNELNRVVKEGIATPNQMARQKALEEALPLCKSLSKKYEQYSRQQVDIALTDFNMSWPREELSKLQRALARFQQPAAPALANNGTALVGVAQPAAH